MSEAPPRNLIGTIGRGITAFRNFVINTLFLLLLLFLVVGAASQCSDSAMPTDAALVLNPKGYIVEEKSIPNNLGDFLSGNQVVETRLGDLTRALELAAADERIKLLLLDLDELAGVAPAHSAALGRAITEFKQSSGKQVISYGNAYSQGQYHLASHADALYMHPLGQIFLQGYGGYNFYFKDLLDKLGVNVHVFRAGVYKSAVEPLMRNGMSEESRQASEALYRDLWQVMLADIGANRELELHALESYANDIGEHVKTAQGDLARTALEHHLVDELLTGDQLRARVADEVGYANSTETLNAIDYQSYLARNPDIDFGGGAEIAVLTAQGPIVMDGPVGQVASADDLSSLIRQARESASIRALVLRVDSPGGSQFASEVVRQELELLQLSGVPVIASFGSMAASGGYWIAATADEIVAEPTSVTGSIGIFSAITTYEDSLQKLGVHADGVGTTDNTLGLNPFTGVNENMAEVLQARVDFGYEQFVNLVAKGRGVDPADEANWASGRPMSGGEALDLGLVDHLGGIAMAVSRAAETAGLDDYRVVHLKTPMDPREQLLAELLQGTVHLGGFEFSSASLFRQQLERLLNETTLLGTLYEPNQLLAICTACWTNRYSSVFSLRQ